MPPKRKSLQSTGRHLGHPWRDLGCRLDVWRVRRLAWCKQPWGIIIPSTGTSRCMQYCRKGSDWCPLTRQSQTRCMESSWKVNVCFSRPKTWNQNTRRDAASPHAHEKRVESVTGTTRQPMEPLPIIPLVLTGKTMIWKLCPMGYIEPCSSLQPRLSWSRMASKKTMLEYH